MEIDIVNVDEKLKDYVELDNGFYDFFGSKSPSFRSYMKTHTVGDLTDAAIAINLLMDNPVKTSLDLVLFHFLISDIVMNTYCEENFPYVAEWAINLKRIYHEQYEKQNEEEFIVDTEQDN